MTGTKIQLNREDMMEAVADGVQRGIVELSAEKLTQFGGVPYIPYGHLLEAIRQGVKDAIWSIANNATDMPCADFYESIKQGVRDAMKQIHIED